MDTSTIQLGVLPDWFTTFADSPLGVIAALTIVVGFLLAARKV